MPSKINSKICLSPPHMSGYEQAYIDEAFRTNWIAPFGTNLNNFEKDIANYLQNDSYVAALNSGTAAIHLALQLLNVKKGDEVICQTKTFAASIFPVIYLGANPIFIDSEEQTWNLCPELLETAIKDRISKGKKPKAIIAVNLYGMPYNINAVNKVSKHYGIPIIEDSAEAFGSCYMGRKCGTFGDISILSFNGNKIITTSGGGALITRFKDLRDKAIFLASQAKENSLEHSHTEIGYNYRMSNIIAGIGRGQMKVLDKHVNLRRRNYEYYFEHLNTYEEITFLPEPTNYFTNRWLNCVLLKSHKIREDLISLLSIENIETKPSWKPMHLQSIFRKYPKYLNGVSHKLYQKGLCLPSGSSLSKNDLNRIISIIQSYFCN